MECDVSGVFSMGRSGGYVYLLEGLADNVGRDFV